MPFGITTHVNHVSHVKFFLPLIFAGLITRSRFSFFVVVPSGTPSVIVRKGSPSGKESLLGNKSHTRFWVTLWRHSTAIHIVLIPSADADPRTSYEIRTGHVKNKPRILQHTALTHTKLSLCLTKYHAMKTYPVLG